MASKRDQAADTWVNDHLDLYNYAVRIGDSDWQDELLGALSQREEPIRLLSNHLALQELWSRFDSVNRRMLEIYDRIRADRNAIHRQTLQRTVLELKQQRVSISRQIRELIR
ncbi:hypothetical protein [Cohnella fermenti]|uniref:Uncharacterized protein n=1 Tax=Cohnella fermenti TaxID=2565925 RepID=A0A4S4C236_9BACL|nr:hypothetical protein [Cohnella fermenti]THF81734.1 hypothetical protein E6C55_08395 [Cohnella fermenti]